MKSFRRIIAVILVSLLLLTQFSTMAFALTDTQKQNIENILGVYDGSYTATQGITGLTLSIYKTNDLLNDDVLLKKYADVASSCGVSASNGGTKVFTVEDIKFVISQHTDDYIALFNFFPMVDEDGVGPNPNVEEGLYTMTVSYNESTGKFDFIGSQWIQHDTYVFADLKNVVLTDDVLSGDVYGEYASFFWTEYGDLGDVSVCSGKGHSGYRIDFENESASLGINEKQKIRAVVKNNEGLPATDAANIKWFSNNESIAKISGENWGDSSFQYATGTIVGVSEGTTEVYAELENKRVATCTVVVSKNGTIAPLEIITSYELISQIISTTEGNITTYTFSPNYKVSAIIKNPDTNQVDNVIVKLNLPDTAALYGDGSLEQTIQSLSSNEDRTITWNIVVEGDPYRTTSIEYTVSAESDQTAEIVEYKTIFVDPFVGSDNRIKYDTDVWNFINSSSYYDAGYFINTEYYNSLINAIGNVERERIESYLQSNWGGSCYGMAVISALTKLEHLTPNNYHSAASNLKDLPAPKDSDEVYSLITYYHMTQKLDAYYTALNNNLALDESQRLIALINAVEKVKIGEAPVVLSIWYMNKDYDIHSIETDYFNGHAILAYDVEYGNYNIKSLVNGTSATYDKRILIYDPNNNQTPIYMYINSDCSEWIVDGYCQNKTKEDGLYWYKGEGYFSFIDDAEIMDSINVEDSISNYYSRLVANANTQLKVKIQNDDGSVDEYSVHGVNINNFADDNIIPYVEGLTGDGLASGFGYFFNDEADTIIITPDSGDYSFDFDYYLSGTSYSVKTEHGEEISFTDNDSVEMECDGDYVITAIYDENNYSTSWYYYSISGNTEGTIGVSQNESGYTIVSGDNLNGLKLTVKGNFGEIVREINTDENSVLIKEDDGVVVLYADIDNNGSFETNLDKLNDTDDSGDSSTDDEETNIVIGFIKDNMLYIGIGVLIVVMVVVVVVAVAKKKRN